MPDTRLILHVKGTEAETTEVPKALVKAAVHEGKLSQSQLIWSPQDNAWKQIREIPELQPGETVILHVKGTEAETQTMPKKAVRAAVSKGEITHSQLIWSANDSAWKQVRELPELMPGETLILHVKGTEAQTQEMPKEAVRAAIAQGKISQSQLIWSAAESAWKQVREWPDLSPGETLILHVKGTEADTSVLPKKAIRSAISKGDITHSQLIWSAAENQWKQVRQMPELLPSQKLAPAPTRSSFPPRTLDGIMPDEPQNPVARAASTIQGPPKVKVALAQARTDGTPQAAQPRVVETAQPRVAAAGVTPKVRVASGNSGTPAARVAVAAGAAVPAQAGPMVAGTAGGPDVRAAAVALSGRRGNHHIVPDEGGPHFLKWICMGLGGLIIVLIGANYFMVDRALQAGIRRTTYADVSVHGHYGAFIQPNVIVIHIPKSTKLTEQDFTDFLVELAHSTPDNPISGDLFSRVALTSGWTAQYSFSGYSWKQLGDMNREAPEQREEFVMSQIDDAAGTPLMPESTLSQEVQDQNRQKTWDAFEAHFVAEPGN